MAKLENPLYGDTATGTLGRALAYRRTATHATVAKIPIMTCPPSPHQADRRALYQSLTLLWRSLSQSEKNFYNTNKPAKLTGYNFFLKLCLLPSLAYFGYCIFGQAIFQLAPAATQLFDDDFLKNFPGGVDESPEIGDGRHSPQALIFNHLYDMIKNVETYILMHDEKIKT